MAWTKSPDARANYGADLALPGMLFGAILRSPHAHARIRKIDTSKALALEGVKAVVTGADIRQASDRVAETGEAVTSIRDLSNNSMVSGALFDYYINEDIQALDAEYRDFCAKLVYHVRLK